MAGTVNVDLSRLRTSSFGAAAEWRIVCTARHNVLLEGPEASTQAVLRLLGPHLREPAAWKGPGASFDLPAGECGTLVVQDIDALNSVQQARLLVWLDDTSRRTQVVATTASPLFPLVARGLFDEVLYYRLNVMLLHVDSMISAGADLLDADDGTEATSSDRQATIPSTSQPS